ncbi:mediator complex, subunit Med18 [Lipomyces oligophaga]|uniref:mediator complex, subunit Med18 n=1 Tax=Lipomyces oligophaga TaxID=45792 RepID=UPI0034CE1B7D
MTQLQELSLFSSLPPGRLAQALSALSASTGMRPIKLLKQHIVFAPSTPGQSGDGSMGPQNAGSGTLLEASRLTASRDLLPASDDSARIGKAGNETDEENLDPVAEWSLSIPSVPESGKQPVQVQAISKTNFGPVPLTSKSDSTRILFRFLRALNYVYAYDYLEQGYAFVHSGRVIITISQISPQNPLQLHEIPSSSSDELVAESVAKGRDSAHARFVGTWIVHAYVEILTGSETVGDDLEKNKTAIERLEAVKAELSGVIDLEVPDRVVLDPRVQLRR